MVRRFSSGQLRISIEQNIYLPWVREENLDLLLIKQTFTCRCWYRHHCGCHHYPGSDTCRLGIASAKGLGSALAASFNGLLSQYAELARPLRIKISGCPNGCAQHSVANIGFYAAALSHGERGVPAHFVTVGGQTLPDKAQFGLLLGKFPAKNCVKVTETLLQLFEREGLPAEDFNSFVSRTGIERLRDILDPLRRVPSFADDPSFYEDYGHEHERFAVRKGVKGECAGSTVAETVPTIEAAREWLAQAEALAYHRNISRPRWQLMKLRLPVLAFPHQLVDHSLRKKRCRSLRTCLSYPGQTRGDWEEFRPVLKAESHELRRCQTNVG